MEGVLDVYSHQGSANMSDKSNSPGPSGKIEYIENHRPALPSGDYKVEVAQTVSMTEIIPAKPGKAPTENMVDDTFNSQD